tara:strand:- start:1927 stop:2862 length:936 start_codon:yes stop_codon:yes gene_type:complete
MIINCYYEFSDSEWNTPRYFEELYSQIKNYYTDFEVNKLNSLYMPERRLSEPCAKYSHAHMIIQNAETKKYFIVTYWDKMECISDYTGWDMENCVEIITASGTHKDDYYYEPLEGHKFIPFSYLTSRIDSDDMIYKLRDTDNNNRVVPKKPMFKGYLYEFRKFLNQDGRFDVKHVSDGEYLPHIEYVKHLNHYAINMSLNGAGQICFRDMEILGLGTALFRPKLSVDFHNPLIPDYHYISVDYDSIKGVKPIDKYYQLLSDLMLKKWNKVKDDRDYINEVAKYGKEWFDNNVPKEKHGEILLNILNFDKLL